MPVTYVSNDLVHVAAPAGPPGSVVTATLRQAGVTGSVQTVAALYAADIAQWTPTMDPAGTVTGTVTGRGLSGSTGWTLTPTTGTAAIPLPVLSTEAAVRTSAFGVCISTDTSAVVRLPAVPGKAGTYTLAFTPSQTLYPGSTYLPSPAAQYTYSPPTLTRLSLTTASTAGGQTLTVTGTNLATLATTTATARLVNAANPAVTATATITAATPTTVTLTVPAAPRNGTTTVTGSYHVVLTSPLGQAQPTPGSDLISYTPVVAGISGWTATMDPAGTVTGTVTGRGLSGSTGWTLTPTNGTAAVPLPVLSTEAAVRTSAFGVCISTDTSAVVRLPAVPGKAGTYTLAFTPSQTLYPGSTYLPSPAAQYTYSPPTLTRLSLTTASTAGGQTLTVTGTNLATLATTTATARLVNAANPAVTATATITAATPTTVTLTVPAAPRNGTTTVTGSYHVVLTSPLGQAQPTPGSDLISYTSTAGPARAALATAAAAAAPARDSLDHAVAL